MVIIMVFILPIQGHERSFHPLESSSRLPWWFTSKESAFNAGDTGARGLVPDQEDPQEKEMATHSNILAWEIPGTEKPGGLQSMESQKC